MRYAIAGFSIVALILFYGCSDYVVAPEGSRQTSDELGDGAVSSDARGGHPLLATVEFGRQGVGSPFPPAEHDQSFHAADKIHPRTTVIAAGGTVTFLVGPFHYAAIYEPGIGVDDIDTSHIEAAAGCPLPIFEDEEGRIDEGPLNCPGTGVVEFSHTFEDPGRYLVICQILPHFVAARMYAWVEVK